MSKIRIDYMDWEGDFGSLTFPLNEAMVKLKGTSIRLKGPGILIDMRDEEINSWLDIENEVTVTHISVVNDKGWEEVYRMWEAGDFPIVLSHIQHEQENAMDFNTRISKAVERKLANKVANEIVKPKKTKKTSKNKDMLEMMFMMQMMQQMNQNNNQR